MTLTPSGSNTMAISSSAEYTSSQNLLSSTTDSRGKTTSYSYSAALNRMLGAASQITNAASTTTSSLWENDGRPSSSYIASVVSLDQNYSIRGRFSD